MHVEIITDNKPNYSHQGLIIVICENTKMLDKYNMLNVRAFRKVAAILKNVVTSHLLFPGNQASVIKTIHIINQSK